MVYSKPGKKLLLTDSIDDWLILADWYEEQKYDNVVLFIKSEMKRWVKWLNKYKYEPIYTGDSFVWINKILMNPRNPSRCYLKAKFYYKICPLGYNYRPEMLYKTKEEAYFDLFLAYLENL